MKMGFEVIQSIWIHGSGQTCQFIIKYNGEKIFDFPTQGTPIKSLSLIQIHSLLENIQREVSKWGKNKR